MPGEEKHMCRAGCGDPGMNHVPRFSHEQRLYPAGQPRPVPNTKPARGSGNQFDSSHQPPVGPIPRAVAVAHPHPWREAPVTDIIDSSFILLAAGFGNDWGMKLQEGLVATTICIVDASHPILHSGRNVHPHQPDRIRHLCRSMIGWLVLALTDGIPHT